MPITEACREASRALKLVQPVAIVPRNDLAFYDSLMTRDDVSVSVSPSLEVQWVAFNIAISTEDKDRCERMWRTAPSKVAATWMRQLRMSKKLKDKFWADTWPYYIENRLALELRAGAPPAAKRVLRGGKTDGDVQASIERMGVRNA